MNTKEIKSTVPEGYEIYKEIEINYEEKTILDKIQDICITIIYIILTLAGIGIIPLLIWGFTS